MHQGKDYVPKVYSALRSAGMLSDREVDEMPEQMCADRSRQVRDEMGTQSEVISKLAELVGRVKDNLTPVMRPDVSVSENDKLSPEPILAPLAEELHSHNRRLIRQCAELEDILTRIEV